tara:strand:- start:1959 stop:2840 length:882 start_codon:yes stop_codon:yes gene_type:complete
MAQSESNNICVIGASGLLGKSLTKFFKEKEINFVTLGRKNQDINIDLSKKNPDLSILKNSKISMIINLAAETDVELCEKDNELSFNANFLVVKNLVSFIKKEIPDCILIHFSTDQVYWGKGLHQENNASYGNYYSECKYLSELEAKKINSIILRTNFFGKSLASKKSFSDWIYKMAKEKQNINLYKNVFFSPLAIESLLNYLFLIISNPIPGTYNLGSHGGLSKSEFSKLFVAALKLNLDYIDIDYDEISNQIKRPLDMRMNLEFFEKVYNVNLPFLIDEINKVSRDYLDYEN